MTGDSPGPWHWQVINEYDLGFVPVFMDYTAYMDYMDHDFLCPQKGR